MSKTWPHYEHTDGIHTMTWEDHSHIIMQRPHLDKNDYATFTQVYSPGGNLVGEGPLRMFDTQAVVRFALRCSATNGTTPVDWNARFIKMAHHVRETLLTLAAATPPEPLRRKLPAAKPYPIDALGTILTPMVHALQAAIQAPDAICAQSVLAGATLAVQGFANVQIDGRTFPVSEYYLDIGESGERRSAVDRCALYPHYTYERALYQQHAEEVLAYTNDLDAWKRTREEILKSKGDREDKRCRLDNLGTPPAEPLDPVMICEEPTYEGLIKLFLRGQRSLGLFSDEGGRFLGGHGMTADQSLKTITGLSELWDGKRVTRVRATDTTIILYGRRLAMHLMMQPVIAQRVLSDPLLHGQGFLNRCLLCWPTSTAGSRLYRDVDLTVDDDVQAYNARIAECLRAKPPRSPERLDELAPRALPLAPPAKKRWIQFHDYVERQLSEGQALRSIRGFGNKAAEHAARLAGVLTLVGDHTAATIPLEELDAALLLVEFYLGEARRLFCPDTTSPDVLLAEDLLAYLRDKDRISLPDIYQRGPEPLREAKTARRIVAILEEHGWLLRLPGSAEVGGVIRRETWEVRHVD